MVSKSSPTGVYIFEKNVYEFINELFIIVV